MVALNYRFSALKNTNLWFKLEPGIGIFFFLAMPAAVSALAERTVCILKENVGPALRVSLCRSVEVPQPFLQSPLLQEPSARWWVYNVPEWRFRVRPPDSSGGD